MAGCRESLKLLLSFRPAVVVLTFAFAQACFFVPSPIAPDAGRFDGGVFPMTDGGMRVDAGLNPSDACGVLNESRCDFLARCGLIDPDAQALERCERYFEATWCGPTTWPAHVAAGTLKYEAARAEACAEAFETQACGEWETLPDSCTRFLLPRVALGGDCYDGFTECLEGVCRGSSCPRTCQPRALLDDPCTNDGECRSPLYCKISPFMPTVGLCAAYGTNGSACESEKQCLDGLHCLNQTCRVLPMPGSPCVDGLCAETGFCDGVADAGVCVARKLEGASCSEGECLGSLVCDPVRSQCVRIQLSSGELCTLVQKCPADEVCLGATDTSGGVCNAPNGEGERCDTQLDCESHLACQSTDGGSACQRRLAADSRCSSGVVCQTGAVCLNSVCTELPLPGQSCSDTRECRWGLCRGIANTDGGAVCGSLLSAAQPCVRGEECASGACLNGTCVARCVP
jgi:hypothetical protein